MEFVKKFFVCDEDVMQTDDIITYGFRVQESLQEYNNMFDSKRLEPNDSKKISKDKPLLMMAYTVAIESPFKNTVEKFIVKSATMGKTINLEWVHLPNQL